VPEYIERLREELEILAEVGLEAADGVRGALPDAAEAMGSAAVERILQAHVAKEVNRRLDEKALERRRAGLS